MPVKVNKILVDFDPYSETVNVAPWHGCWATVWLEGRLRNKPLGSCRLCHTQAKEVLQTSPHIGQGGLADFAMRKLGASPYRKSVQESNES